MVESANGLDAGAKRLMLYFAEQIKPIEVRTDLVDTSSLWSGVVIGFIVGAIVGVML